MTKIEFTNLGQGDVLRTTAKAALFRLESTGDEIWIPYSVLSTPTAAESEYGATIERIRVESWFAEKNELEEEDN